MKIHRTHLCAAAACWLLSFSACAADTRQEFRDALSAAEAGHPATTDTAELRGYILYPYLQAARLQASLKVGGSEELDAAVPAFLNTYPDFTLRDSLRRAWLNSLADRQLWSELLAQTSTEEVDPALRCHTYNAWINNGGYQGLEQELKQFWLTGRQLPQACVQPFQWLKERGVLTPALAEQRARLALAAGNAELAEYQLRMAPADRVPPLRRWLELQKDPLKQLKALAAEPALMVEWLALRDGWNRLIRRSPEEASTLLPALIENRKLNAAEAQELRLGVALGLSWNRDKRALDYFRQVDDEVLDHRAHEWRVRAALWHGEWKQALDWLHRMPPALSAEPRWTYWRARALEANGIRAQAAPLLDTLSQSNGYYGLLSAHRLGVPPALRSVSAANEPLVQQALLKDPRIQRARELVAVERKGWANLEWRIAYRSLGKAQQLQAARLANSWGWHVQAVAVLREIAGDEDLGLLYPEAYTREVEKAAASNALPASWIFSVMRQESLFDAKATSSADALGLLQLLPRTAREVAKSRGLPTPSREDLFLPERNIPLGAGYLRQMTDRFGGQFVLTLASYNAGPTAVARWLPEAPMDTEVWIENIPFNETRDYVQKIVWNVAVYAGRHGTEPQDFKALLKPVQKIAAP